MTRLTRQQIAMIAIAVVAIASLRFAVGSFALQGVLYVAVTAVSAWRIGVNAGLLSVIFGFVAAHAQRIIANPTLLHEPTRMFDRQYAVSYTAYVVLSALALAIGHRHRQTVVMLQSTQADKEAQHDAHVIALEAALGREQTARREAEQANRERAQLLTQLARELERARHLAAIVESSDDIIVATDLSGTIQSWNRTAEQTFGISSADAVGQNVDLVIPSDRRDEEQSLRARLAQGESVVHFATERRRADGSLVPVSLTLSPIFDARGVLVGASRIARDISTQVQAQAAVAELQGRLLALLAASRSVFESPTMEDVGKAIIATAHDLIAADGCALWRVNPSTGVWRIQASAGVSEHFVQTTVPAASPVRLEDVVAVSDVTTSSLLSTRQAAYVAEGIGAILSIPLTAADHTVGTVVFYFRARHAFADTELHAARAFGNLATAALTTADLYDAQRRSGRDFQFLAEAGVALAESLDPNVTLSKVAQLAVPYFADWCAVDLIEPGGDIRRVAVAHIDPEKVALAQRFHRDFPESPSSPTSVVQVVRTGRPVLIDHLSDDLIVRAARNEAHLAAVRALGVRSFMVVPIRVRGQSLGAMLFARTEAGRDYTSPDVRLAEAVASRVGLMLDNSRAYAEATQANRLKDEFLATLSHELRTPLNAVLGYSRMMNGGAVDPSRLARGLSIIERNATALNRLVEDILDVSRIMSGKVLLNRRAVAIPAIVDQVLAGMRAAADAKGITVSVTADRGLSPVSGDPDRLQQVFWNVLSNAIKFTPAGGQVRVRLAHVDRSLEVTVSDTGRGISAEFLPHVFDRFRQQDAGFTREHGGLGLGLAIAKDLVELHGGSIHAASDGENLGATFRVVLPAQVTEHAAAPQARLEGRLHRVNVLAVDDEPDAVALVRDILEAAGATVVTARSAHEGLQVLDALGADVIVSDIGMPDVSGVDFIRQVRQSTRFSAVPAVALTGYADPQLRADALRAGFHAHLVKPADAAVLVDVLRELTAHLGGRDEKPLGADQ
jgi:PAS domain S-box-containing protein